MNYQEFYNQSIQSPEAFWKEQADQLEWYSKPTTFLLNSLWRKYFLNVNAV